MELGKKIEKEFEDWIASHLDDDPEAGQWMDEFRDDLEESTARSAFFQGFYAGLRYLDMKVIETLLSIEDEVEEV